MSYNRQPVAEDPMQIWGAVGVLLILLLFVIWLFLPEVVYASCLILLSALMGTLLTGDHFLITSAALPWQPANACPTWRRRWLLSPGRPPNTFTVDGTCDTHGVGYLSTSGNQSRSP